MSILQRVPGGLIKFARQAPKPAPVYREGQRAAEFLNKIAGRLAPDTTTTTMPDYSQKPPAGTPAAAASAPAPIAGSKVAPAAKVDPAANTIPRTPLVKGEQYPDVRSTGKLVGGGLTKDVADAIDAITGGVKVAGGTLAPTFPLGMNYTRQW